MQDFVGRVRRAVEGGGRYVVERELGRGGMATVFLARDVRHDRPVAVKVLHPNLIASASAERFLREIRIAAGLAHPNILPLHDSGEAGGLLYYVMPYVEGETLRRRLAREGALPLDDAVRIAREVAGALAHAHERGVVHRDVKPENVLLMEGHAVVADFGVARAVHRAQETPITSDGLVVGTPAYVSPEQAAGGGEVDARGDVYSLGCVLFELLAGAPPFTGPTPQVVLALQRTAPPPPLRAYREGVPPLVEAAVARALAKSPADRFPSARAMADALRAALPGDVPTPEGTQAPGAGSVAVATPLSLRAVRLRGRLRAAVVAALAGAAALTAVLARRADQPPPGEVWLVAAPFTVLSGDSAIRFWGEGVVDALSFNLNDVGPLRAVQPSVSDAHWPERVDATSAAELARRTGARFAVYGAIADAGRGSVRLSASLLDVGADSTRPLREFRWDAPASELAYLTDSLTRGVLGEVGTRVRLGAVRGAWLGALTSTEALKEFLRGEQAYRRSAWGPAIEHYHRALAVDSTFAPALRRVAAALGWQGTDADSLVNAYRARAAAHARALPARESLLIVIDSLRGAMTTAEHDTLVPASAYWRSARRLFDALGEASRRWPDDAEISYALADAQYHYATGPLAVAPERMLANFDRAIALDSGFAPSYVHPVELGFMLGGDTLGLRYAARYLALGGEGITAEGVRLLVALVGARDGAAAARLLADVSPDTLMAAANTLDRWTDPAETTVELTRRVDVRRRGAPTPGACDVSYRSWARRLAYRGHLAAAWCRLGAEERRSNPLVADLALLDAVPAESASAAFARWLDAGVSSATHALPWWTRHGDTLSVHRLRARAAAVARGPGALARDQAAYDTAAADAYLALARGDTAAALARFVALPETLCRACFAHDRLTRARLLAARGRFADAQAILAGWLGPQVSPLEIAMALERARVAERAGEGAEAARAYATVARAWANADPPLRALAVDAAARAERLTAVAARPTRAARAPGRPAGRARAP